MYEVIFQSIIYGDWRTYGRKFVLNPPSNHELLGWAKKTYLELNPSHPTRARNLHIEEESVKQINFTKEKYHFLELSELSRVGVREIQIYDNLEE